MLTPDDYWELASRPEPAPVAKGDEVTPALVEWLDCHRSRTCDCLECRQWESAIGLVCARDFFGRAKYGQPLMTGDGRDTIEEARQELGDLMQYVWKARMQGLDLEPIRRLLPVLVAMLEAGARGADQLWTCMHHGPQRGAGPDDPDLCEVCMTRLDPPEAK